MKFDERNDALIENADLRIFARVVDVGTLSGAAATIGIPKSTVSRALARLEALLGAALVERSARRVRPTDAGRDLYPHALRVLDDLEEAVNAVRGGRAAGTLRVNAPSSFSRHLITPRLPALLDAYPDLDVVLDIDDERIDLIAAEADVAIRIGPLPDSDLVARLIRKTALLACASANYVHQHGRPRLLADLAGHRLVGRWDRVAGSPPGTDALLRTRVTIHAPDVLERLLVAGGGIGLLPDYVAEEPLRNGSLVRVLEGEGVRRVDVHALCKVRRHCPAKIRVFIDALSADRAVPFGL